MNWEHCSGDERDGMFSMDSLSGLYITHDDAR